MVEKRQFPIVSMVKLMIKGQLYNILSKEVC